MTNNESLNNWIKKNYPRKCEHCDYVANNPAMYSYHKKTHEPIPEGTVCDIGCGQLATHRNTSGKVVCNEVSHRCPEYTKQHSERVKQHWNSKEGKLRRQNTNWKELHRKGNETKKETGSYRKPRIHDPETAKTYRYYARAARARAQKWAKSEGYEIGKHTYNVDHIVCLLDCFENDLPIDIANHPCNLQIITAKENSRKGTKIVLTVAELLEKIEQWNKDH